MSIHPSLNISDKDKKARSVLKRTERLKKIIDKGSWKEGQSIYGLPKVKTTQIKIKKTKSASAETAATAEGAAEKGAPAAEKKPAEKKPAK